MKCKIEYTDDDRLQITSDPKITERTIVFPDANGNDVAKCVAFLALAKIPYIFDIIEEEGQIPRAKIIVPDANTNFESIFWFSRNNGIEFDPKLTKEENPEYNLEASIFHAIQLLKKHAGVQVTVTPYKRDSRFDGL